MSESNGGTMARFDIFSESGLVVATVRAGTPQAALLLVAGEADALDGATLVRFNDGATFTARRVRDDA
jgi:hypothetical protein